MLAGLPAAVQKWLGRSGVIGKEKIYFVRMKQKIEIRSNPGDKKLCFKAERYFSPQSPVLVWQTRMQKIPLTCLNRNINAENNHDKILTSDLPWSDLIKASRNKKMNERTLLLYLSEICWFPSAALNKYIQWEAINTHSAKVTINCKGSIVSGVFEFDKNGDMVNFSSGNCCYNGQYAPVEKWQVEIKAYSQFNGIRIPGESEIKWKTTTGNINSIKLEITDLEFNKAELYR